MLTHSSQQQFDFINIPTPVFLPVESHGQRSLVSYSPWEHKELDMTESDWAARDIQ